MQRLSISNKSLDKSFNKGDINFIAKRVGEDTRNQATEHKGLPEMVLAGGRLIIQPQLMLTS